MHEVDTECSSCKLYDQQSILLITERKDNKKRIFVTFVLYNHKFSSSDKQQPLADGEW